MANLKHIGRHNGTGQRLVIVYLQVPGDEDNALVVYSDALPDRYHEDFMMALESAEGQASANLADVLNRKNFFNGLVMLQALHNEGRLTKVPHDQIILTPNTQTNVPLPEVVKVIREQESGEKTTEEIKNDSDERSQVDINVDESKQDENRQIAQNLLVQARLLEQDAEAKRQEAYKFDPSLEPKKGRTSKAQKEMAAAVEAAVSEQASNEATVDA